MLTTEKPYENWQHEQAAVEAALDDVLPALKRPLGSVQLAIRLCPLVSLPERRIRKILLWIAKGGHSHATQDGGHVRVYGRDAVLWRWHPTPHAAIPADGLEARLNEAGVVDTTEW